jgi:uncharacterized membrane protein
LHKHLPIFYLETFEGFILKPIRWFGIVVAFTVLTLLTIYFTPNSEGFSFVLVPRYILSFIFISFLPGYCLVNALFLGKNKLDIIEKLVLSVALSFGLAGLVGLFLGLSSVGISFSSITISLSTIVLLLAALAFIRKTKESSLLDVQVL